MKECVIMVKKSPSPAVQKSVESAVKTVPVETPVVAPTRGPKKFSTEQYLAEYLVEQKAGGTWESLCQRTGFKLENVRQCITMLRSEYRAAMRAKAEASVDFMKSLAKIKKDVEVWADEKAAERFPFLAESGTRNTQKAKLRQSWKDEELSL
jgi:hypothetical protein